MMTCVESALRYARFGIDEADMCSLFMVNEAEAAAAHVLHASAGSLTVCIDTHCIQVSANNR